MSKSNLNIYIKFKNKNEILKSKVYKFKTNSRAPLEINVSEIVSELKLKNITAFSVIAESINGKIPTRVNHQLVYGGIKKCKL